jgi:cell filamentation protein
MYDAVADPYCYPDTTVLINKLDLRDQAKLDAFEAEITTQRAAEPFPDGRLTYAHYRAIHRHLFQDVYAWAGQVRNVRIAKDGSMFCYPEHIDSEMRKLFGELRDSNYYRELAPKTFAESVAHFLSELNAIHPFREGNGRTQLALLTLLAERAGHPLALDNLDPSTCSRQW